MNHSVLIALFVCGVSLAAAGQEMDTAKELISAEQAFNQALIRGDWRTIESLETEDLVFTDADGTVSGKSNQIAELKSGFAKFESIEMSEVKVQDLGNAAVVTGKLVEKGRYKDADLSGVYRFTDVWARRNGRWVLVAGQETRKTN
jgi:ketosteroid isomerase-like protein